MSSHPNPGNRSAYITQEARSLRVEHPVRDTADFTVRQKPPGGHAAGALVSGGRASRPLAAAIRTRARHRRPPDDGGRASVLPLPCLPGRQRLPCERARQLAGALDGRRLRLVCARGRVWPGTQRAGGVHARHAVRRRPHAGAESRGGHAAAGAVARAGQPGAAAGEPAAADALREPQGIAVQLRNQSDATGGDEVVSVYTTLLPDDTLLYGIGVAPQEEWRRYGPVFDRVVGTARVSQ